MKRRTYKIIFFEKKAARSAFSHFDGIVCLRDRVQVGQVDYIHGRRRWRRRRRLLQDTTKLDIETVGGQRGRAGRDVGFSSGGDGHDLGLRIPVVTYVICHHGRYGTAIAVASIVVIVVVIAAAVC